MKRNICLFAAVLLILGTRQIFGIPATGWGSVDTRLLLILHPEMGNYDYIYGRFFRRDINSKAGFDLGKALEKGRKETQADLDCLHLKRSDLLRKREAIHYDKENRIQSVMNPRSTESESLRVKINRAKKDFAFLNKDKNVEEIAQQNTKPAPLSNDAKRKLLNEIEAKANGEIQNVQKELNETDKEIFLLKEKMYSEVYLTASETMDKLFRIKTEIQGLIASTATESNIGIVIDSTFGMRPVKKVDDLYINPIVPDSPDTLSSAVFNNFANWEPPKAAPPGPDGKPATLDHMLPAILTQKTSDLRKYLELRNYLKDQAAAFTPGKLFLIGGNDITVQVAKKLFVKYRLPEPLKNAFLGVIEEYLSFEKANFQR